MGYDLTNAAGGYVRFTGSGWDLALAVARHYGWQPTGTRRPADWDDDNSEWADGYWANVGQEVVAADAANMAAALERILASSDFVDAVSRLLTDSRDRVDVELGRGSTRRDPDVRGQAEGFRPRAAELATFARQGAFVIE